MFLFYNVYIYIVIVWFDIYIYSLPAPYLSDIYLIGNEPILTIGASITFIIITIL